MKIRLNVRSEVYDALAAELAAHGIELSYDAQLMLSEVNQYPDYLSGKPLRNIVDPSTGYKR